MPRHNFPWRQLPCALLFLAGTTPDVSAHQDEGKPVDIRNFVRNAEFVFKGTVTQVQYRESETVPLLNAAGGPLLDDNGNPEIQDGSGLPHTFVTYHVERVYMGKGPTDFTIRLVGGVADKPYEEIDPTTGQVVDSGPKVAEVSTMPLFDIGDRDILFVHHNGVAECPLAGCENGRMRLLKVDGLTTPMLYNESGFQLVKAVPPTGSPAGTETEVAWGRYTPTPETLTHTYLPGLVVETKSVEVKSPREGAPRDPDRPLGRQFTEAQFDKFLAQIIKSTLTPAEISRLPPVASADPTKPFFGLQLEEAVFDTRPSTPAEEARPWLDELPSAERARILAQEEEEAQQLKASGGNPVIPAIGAATR